MANQAISQSPDLAAIVAAWPKLPEHIKVAIKALADVHKGDEAP